MSEDAQALRLVEDDETRAIVDESPPLLGCTEAVCFCFKMEPFFYAPHNAKKLVFHFRILEPQKHENIVVKMFVPAPPKGKRLSVSSKLYQAARVAAPNLKGRARITRSMFLKKIFRCELGPTSGRVPREPRRRDEGRQSSEGFGGWVRDARAQQLS